VPKVAPALGFSHFSRRMDRRPRVRVPAQLHRLEPARAADLQGHNSSRLGRGRISAYRQRLPVSPEILRTLTITPVSGSTACQYTPRKHTRPAVTHPGENNTPIVRVAGHSRHSRCTRRCFSLSPPLEYAVQRTACFSRTCPTRTIPIQAMASSSGRETTIAPQSTGRARLATSYQPDDTFLPGD